MELGIYTFGEVTADPSTGEATSPEAARPRPARLTQYEIFGHDRFLVQFSVGTLPHRSLMRSIELFGTAVAPVVRGEIERRAASAASAA